MRDAFFAERLADQKRRAREHRGLDRLARYPQPPGVPLHRAERGESVGSPTARLLQLLDAVELEEALMKAEAEGAPHVPIIAVTAHAIKGDRDRYLALGADDYVSKPIRADWLLEAMARVTSGTNQCMAAQPVAASAAYDYEALLQQTNGDHALIRDLAHALAEETRDSLAVIDAAWQNGELEVVSPRGAFLERRHRKFPSSARRASCARRRDERARQRSTTCADRGAQSGGRRAAGKLVVIAAGDAARSRRAGSGGMPGSFARNVAV